jgi:hypothetical protein
MTDPNVLTSAQAAAYAGINPNTWRGRVKRGTAPPPDGHLDARTPYWHPATIDNWAGPRRVTT